jgi:predicted transcriptional regulator
MSSDKEHKVFCMWLSPEEHAKLKRIAEYQERPMVVILRRALREMPDPAEAQCKVGGDGDS